MAGTGFTETDPDRLIRHLLGTRSESGPLGMMSLVRHDEVLRLSPMAIRWSSVPREDRVRVLTGLPDAVGFTTSGHTGPPLTWFRTRRQLLAEVALLRRILQARELDGVISFAPPYHVYGFLTAFLLPVACGIDACLWPASFQHSVRLESVTNPLFVAIPSALPRLVRQHDGLRSYHSVTVVHSTALLPLAGRTLIRRLGPPKLRLVELFGSTETGLIASRADALEDPDPWDLAPDVVPIGTEVLGTMVPLRVRGPRLAFDPTGRGLSEWATGDLVRIEPGRRLVVEGRESLMLKVDGRRVYLDRVERLLREAVPCRDLACVPTRDDLRGEGYEVLVRPDKRRPVSLERARSLCRTALRENNIPPPTLVSVVAEIPRTLTDKVRLGELRSE